MFLNLLQLAERTSFVPRPLQSFEVMNLMILRGSGGPLRPQTPHLLNIQQCRGLAQQITLHAGDVTATVAVLPANNSLWRPCLVKSKDFSILFYSAELYKSIIKVVALFQNYEQKINLKTILNTVKSRVEARVTIQEIRFFIFSLEQ